jgi:hypothetical protein
MQIAIAGQTVLQLKKTLNRHYAFGGALSAAQYLLSLITSEMA